MKPSDDVAEKLVGIECLNCLFWNYHAHAPDLAQHEYVNALYEDVVKKSGNPFLKWWKIFFTQMDYPTKIILVEYALSKYRRLTEYTMSKSRPFQ